MIPDAKRRAHCGSTTSTSFAGSHERREARRAVRLVCSSGGTEGRWPRDTWSKETARFCAISTVALFPKGLATRKRLLNRHSNACSLRVAAPQSPSRKCRGLTSGREQSQTILQGEFPLSGHDANSWPSWSTISQPFTIGNDTTGTVPSRHPLRCGRERSAVRFILSSGVSS
jgi:hypothetical protein